MQMDVPSSVVWAVGVTAVAGLFYRYATSTFDTFKKLGVPGPDPKPLIGNMWGVWRDNALECDMALAKRYGRVYGVFDGLQPNLFVADADLIKQIFIKDFDRFPYRRDFQVREKINRMMLTALRGQQWKDVRSVVSPAFTTGKIKRMSNIITRCTQSLIETLDHVIKAEGKVNLKDHFNRLTMNVIAQCAFGMKIENIEKGEDEFTRNASAIFDNPYAKSPVILIPFAFPFVFKLGAEKAFQTKEIRFFQQMAAQMVAERKRNPGDVDDFITVALESIKESVDGGNLNWDESEIEEIVAAQSMLFLLAGFDTTSTAITMAAYSLAMHPDIQERLHTEISEAVEIHGEVNHDLVNSTPYVEQFVNEVLRMYPPGLRVERECAQTTQYDNLKIEKGTLISVPIYAVHHDEKYYPDPETFDPERWSPDNKANRNPYAFLPFGLGPRNCVAMRFAVEEIKIGICHLVQRFRFFRVEETPETYQHDTGFLLLLQPKNMVVGAEPR